MLPAPVRSRVKPQHRRGAFAVRWQRFGRKVEGPFEGFCGISGKMPQVKKEEEGVPWISTSG